MGVSMSRQRVVSSVVAGVLFASTNAFCASDPALEIKAKPGRTELSTPTVEVAFDDTTGQPVVEAMIGDKGPFRLVLDTGARFTKLDDDLAILLKLEPKRRSIPAGKTGTPPEQVDTIRLPSMKVGGVRFLDFDAVILDYDQVFEGARKYDGAIGFPVFADVLLELDYPQQRAVLKRDELPPADRKEILNYTTDDGLARIPLLFTGTSVDVTLDSGRASAIVLAKSLENRVRVSTKPVQPGFVAADLGIKVTPLRGKLRLGRHRISEPPVFFLGTDSAMGHRILKHFAVTFDQKHHRVRFARAGDEPVRFGPEPGFGLIVGQRRNRLVIKHVIPGSPADRIALRAGDKILEVNSKPASDYDQGSLTRILASTNIITMKVVRDGVPLLIRLEKDPVDTEDQSEDH